MITLKTTKPLTALLLAVSATSLTAIERPIPAEQPKEKKVEEPQPKADALPMPKAKEAKLALRPYLGVTGNPCTEAMAAQLNLEKGAGLTLLFVEGNSSAAKAGLKRHDIITKLNGAKINNQRQLRNAILKCKPHQKVELSYISGGKTHTKQIELGSAPLRNLVNPQQMPNRVLPKFRAEGLHQGAIPMEMLENLPPEQRKQLQQLMQGNLNKLDFRNLKNLDVDQLQKHFEGFEQMQHLELNLNDLMKQGKGLGNKHSMKMIDPEGSITLETEGDKKSIELYDSKGKLLYKGPFNNDADKLKIPENLRERTNKLPKFDIQQDNRKLKGLNGLKKLDNPNMPKELQELLKQLEANGPQGFVIPKGMQPGNGNLMQKFEFNLGAGGEFGNNMSQSLTDAKGNRYTKRQHKDGKEIEVHDAKGKLLFSGPYNSSVDKEMVPEEYRPSLERLDKMKGFTGDLKNGLKLELGPEQP